MFGIILHTYIAIEFKPVGMSGVVSITFVYEYDTSVRFEYVSNINIIPLIFYLNHVPQTIFEYANT